MEVGDLRGGSTQRCSFDSIPNEIIEYHIFGYFWFHYWTQHFVSVCKRWKQICENTKIVPKHLRIPKLDVLNVGKAILWVKKYQPTILELDGEVSGYAIQALVGASECIDTLIVGNNDLLIEGIEPSHALYRITTLVWREIFDQQIFKFFPALQRLQIRMSDLHYPCIRKFPVEELTIINPRNVQFSLEEIQVPKLTVVTDNKVFKRSEGIITELTADDMTYEEYFRYFGKTKFYVKLLDFDTCAATKLLETSTSYEYEADLVKTNLISYKYPTRRNKIVNYDELFRTNYYEEHPDELLFSSLLPVSDGIRFACLANQGEVTAAMAILAKTGAKIIKHRNSDRIRFGFFKLLSSAQLDTAIFSDNNVREVATAIMNNEVCTLPGNRWFKSSQQFEKVAELFDWSKKTAVIDDYDLFWAMIERGAKIPYKMFYRNLLKDDVTLILKKLSDREPSMWYDILSVSSGDSLKIMERYGISPMIEKNGRALWYAWLQNKELLSDDVVPLYVDHMDDYGSTPLITAIEHMNNVNQGNTQRLLNSGADPNLHQRGKLSPLATLVVNSTKDCPNYTDLMILLVNAGADVNLACSFEGRQCSPLMIAVLVGSPLPTISLLIALGARTDYCDDQGRSVVDCVAASENKYKASDYRTLKWLLNGSK